MLTEQEAIGKLKEYGSLFNVYVGNREWGKAHNIYRAAVTIAVFLKIPQMTMDELFGGYQEDGYPEMDTGLFNRKDVARVDLECCVRRNMAYEDMALRKQGHNAQYYSDSDYCARCRIIKKMSRQTAIPPGQEGIY